MKKYSTDKFQPMWVYLWALVGLIFVTVGCNGSDLPENEAVSGAPVVVTEVVSVQGTELVVTRIVQQTAVPVLPTVQPVDAQTDEWVVLDTAYVRSGPPAIDPQKNMSQDGIDLVENIFVGLTRFNYQTQAVEPMLAREWEASDNGRTWTFDLRDDIYWVTAGEPDANGLATVTPVRRVTAQDVVFAVQRACHPDTDTPEAFILFIITGCETVHTSTEVTAADLNAIGVHALNENTLRISLNKPAAYLPAITSMWLFRPLPPEMITEFGDGWQEDWADEDISLMTSGPYFPHSGELKTLQWNPLWPEAAQGNVDMVQILYLGEEMNALQLWDAKRLDVLDINPRPLSQLSERQQVAVRTVPQQVAHYMMFNFDSGVFREPELRRAFSAAIDREQLIEDLFGEQPAFPMRHLMPPGVLGGLPVDEVGIGYNPDYARQQMAASGFRSCRLMPDITFLVSSSDRSLQQAESMRRMWIEELDCTEEQIQIEQVQFGTLLANTRQEAGADRPDIWELAWASYYPDAHNWMGNLMHCEDSENRPRRPCSAVDDQIREANSVVDLADRAALYRQIENVFFGEGGVMPLTPLYVQGDQMLAQSWVGFVPGSFGGAQFDRYVLDYERKELELSR
jgi:ABC-type oligopeptide transport system substrate-binding subunit